jgi:hypothetical protein
MLLRTLKTIFPPLIVLLTACAGTPQAPVGMSEEMYQQQDPRVGVYLSELPETNVHIYGAACLLCIAVAEAANSKLSSQFETLTTDELVGLDGAVQEILAAHGIPSTIISDPIDYTKLKKFKSEVPGYSKQDFRPLKEQLNIDYLAVINIQMAGAYRPYSNYVPTGSPVGYVSGLTFVVDLSTNEYEMYEIINLKINADGDWDEPPSYPGVTSAYFRALEMAKDQVNSAFTRRAEVAEKNIQTP